jgi:predicted DCC family thiol-disulfide oxidoreductase YuxK
LEINNKNIVVFDGVCNLCHYSVELLLRLDSKKILSFTSLQGETVKQLDIHQERLALEEQSILYKRKNSEVLYYRSDAIIEILKDLFSLGFIFSIFKLIPRFIRDGIYRYIAKNRYKLFGKKETCRIPTEEEKSRFLA